MFSRLANILRRHWSERAAYRSTGDWLLSVYNRLLIHAPGMPLPGRGRVREVRLASLDGASVNVRLASSDWYVLEEIFLHGEYESVTSAINRPPQTIVDLGANVGMSIRWWQTRYPDAKIVAVEPDAANLSMARKNVANAARVTFIQGCVAHARTVRLDRSRDEYSFRMSDANLNGDSVIAYPLTEILDLGGIGPDEPIDLLKCDIEGAEAEVFGDCSAWIGRVRNLAIELHAPYTTQMFLDDLRREGSALAVVSQQSKGDLNILRLAAPT